MKISDKLYREALVRVGKDEMKGVTRLITEGHTGLAESAVVKHLVSYMQRLEKQLGITVPNANEATLDQDFIKVNHGGVTQYVPRAQNQSYM